ncbi:uncharacterized protein LOC143201112 isoform X2 [Rhynchophorus ferrugineus]|uniref:uncharacterized protein LOC143201112 isoform X2 n=1 Tax=Rhynchophorus ferrugineus TaxID=354439 RepID=UPI003FCC6B24
MPLLNIFSLDDVDFRNIIVSLSNGSHIIGRGELLNVNDKRVSRKHAQIDITDDAVTLTSTHQNPCFIKASQSSNLTILKQNERHELSSGDQFALLPDNYWFKVKINNTNVQNNEPENINGKRFFEDNTEPDLDVFSKKIRTKPLSIDQEHKFVPADTSTTPVQFDLVSDSEIIGNVKSEPVETTSDNTSVMESIDVLKSETDNTNANGYLETNNEPSYPSELVVKNEINQDINLKTADVKLENIEESTDNGETEQDSNMSLNNSTEEASTNVASNSQPKVREKCWYGENCFRKNPAHKELYSHPGDDDYMLKADDNIPDCPYGASCYRTNITHRQQFRHPTKATNNGQTQRKRRPNREPASDHVSDDDYDYNDPFINDNSSDDFEPSDDDYTDSDWEDSGELVEELEERKRLLREAKRYTKPH